jgi:hypothetical protein
MRCVPGQVIAWRLLLACGMRALPMFAFSMPTVVLPDPVLD